MVWDSLLPHDLVHGKHADGIRYYNRYANVGSTKTFVVDKLSLFDIDVSNLDVLVWFIRLVRLHILDRMHRLQPRKKAAEDGVFVVEPWRGIGGDEELGSVRVRTCVCHAQSIRPAKKEKKKRKEIKNGEWLSD